MNTVVEDSKLSKAEAFIRSSLEAKVKDLTEKLQIYIRFAEE